MGDLSLQTKWSKIILRFPYCQTWRHPFSIVIVEKRSLKYIDKVGLWNCCSKETLIQVRSERGSQRLPREHSSEISKNCQSNSFPRYMRVEINRAGVFGTFNFWFWYAKENTRWIYLSVEINRSSVFGTFYFWFWYAKENSLCIYLRLEINRAGVFWTFYFWFWYAKENSLWIYLRLEINWAGAFGTFYFWFWYAKVN